MSETKPKWECPEWLEPYRELIGNTGGNSLENLMNDKATTFKANALRATLIVAVESQIGLLYRLNERGLLNAQA